MVYVKNITEALSYINSSEWNEICEKRISKNGDSEDLVYICSAPTEENFKKYAAPIISSFSRYNIPYFPDMFNMFIDEYPELYKNENGVTLVIPTLPDVYWIKNANSMSAAAFDYANGVLRLNGIPVPVIAEIEKRFG